MAALWFDLSVFSSDSHLVNTIFQNETLLACRRERQRLALHLDSLVNAKEPELILHSDMDLGAGTPREPLVGAILDLAAAGGLVDPNRTAIHRYAKLAHDGLHPQLAPFINGRQHPQFARLMAIDIAHTCNERRSLPDLAAVAFDVADDVDVRGALHSPL